MNPIIRLAAIAIVAAIALGGAIYVFRPASLVGPPKPTIEGTWEASFTRQQMLAAGLADAGEDDASNYGHFVFVFEDGTFSQVQLDRPHGAGGGTYTLEGATITLHQANGETFAGIPFAVTDTSLTFGRPAPVGLRTVPWSRIAQPVPAASAGTVTLESYRVARNTICAAARRERQAFDARIGSGLYDPATPAADRAAKLTAFEDFAAWAGQLVDKLDGLAVPSSMAVDESIAIADGRATLVLIREQFPLIQAGRLTEAQAIDQMTDPLSRSAERFERKYALEPCP